MALKIISDKPPSVIFIAGLISSLVLIIYSKTVHFDFVYLDDPQFVINNFHLSEGFSLENIWWAFTSSTDISNYWIPITWLSFILDYNLYGLNPGGFHFTNFLLHLLNAILLFVCLLKFTQKSYPSAFVALLFAVHPLHVESVAWISERKDVLSTFFFLLTLLSYHYYLKSSRILTYLAVMGSFLLGILSKPMLVTLPFILLLIDFWPSKRVCFDSSLKSQKRIILKIIIEKVPFILVIIFLSFMAYITQKKGHAITPFYVHPPLMRIENLFVAYMIYLKKMVWPLDLAAHYPYPGQFPYRVIAFSVFAFTFISYYSLKKIKILPFIAFGWSWFIITLFPVIGIILIGPYLIADRYAYISLIGIYIAVTWSCAVTITNKYPQTKNGMIAISVGIILVLTVLSWRQVQYWENSEELFKRTFAINPHNSVAHNNLATYYNDRHQYLKAISHYQEAIRISPNYANAYYNLGNTFKNIQKYNKSIQNYLKAVELNPKNVEAYNNLGIAYFFVNDLDQSIISFRKALQIAPNYIIAKENLQRVLIEKENSCCPFKKE